MKEVQVFKGKDIIGNIVGAVLLFGIGYLIIDSETIAGIALMIGSLISIISILQDDIKTVLFEDKIVVHKVFRAKEILLNQISSLIKERRSSGLYGTRECLIITFTESSGYGDELVYAYDKEMHELIKNQLAASKMEKDD